MPRAKKPPFRYYVVLDAEEKPPRAKTVKSREPVAGSIFDHDLREHAVDHQKMHNHKLKNLRRSTLTAVRRESRVVQRSAPAFRAYAQKFLQQAHDKRAAVMERGEAPE